MGTSFCFTYNRVNASGSGKGKFNGRLRHRGDVSQLHFRRVIQVVLWGGYKQYEEIKGMVKAQEWRLEKVGEEDDGSYILYLSCVLGGDVD